MTENLTMRRVRIRKNTRRGFGAARGTGVLEWGVMEEGAYTHTSKEFRLLDTCPR